MITTSDGEQYEDAVAHALGVKMPSQAPTEPTDASKSTEGTQVPDNSAQTKTITIVRHGATHLNNNENNSVDKIRGWSDVPLTDEGRDQAHKAGQQIAGVSRFDWGNPENQDFIKRLQNIPMRNLDVEPSKNVEQGKPESWWDWIRTGHRMQEGYRQQRTFNEENVIDNIKHPRLSRDLGIDSIHTSDLSRAHETAKIIGAYIGVEPKPTDKLRPWDLGDFTGKSTKDSLPHIQDYAQNKPDEPVPNGESFNQFKERAFEGLHEAMDASDNPLIVTHHRTERLLKAWDKAGQPEDHSIDMPTFLQKGEDTGKVEQMDIKSMTHATPEGKLQTPLLQQLSQKLLETNQTIGDLMTGRIDPASEEGIKKMTDIAAKTMGYGMLGAEKYAAGVFGGQLTALARGTAEGMEARGKNALAIKAATGLERGAEGMWRKEISDYPSKVNLQREPTGLPGLWTKAEEEGLGPLREGTFRLGDIYEHPQLYKDYPELKNLPVIVSEEEAYGAHGMFSYNPGDPTQSKLILNPKTSMDPRMVIAHEVQHYIQNKEGFSIGHPGHIVPDDVLEGFKGRLLRKYKTKEIDDVFNETDPEEARYKAAHILSHADYLVYRALAHESEAHAVGDRVNIPIKDIRKSLGSEDEPIDRRDQLILFNQLNEYGLGIPQK